MFRLFSSKNDPIALAKRARRLWQKAAQAKSSDKELTYREEYRGIWECIDSLTETRSYPDGILSELIREGIGVVPRESLVRTAKRRSQAGQGKKSSFTDQEITWLIQDMARVPIIWDGEVKELEELASLRENIPLLDEEEYEVLACACMRGLCPNLAYKLACKSKSERVLDAVIEHTLEPYALPKHLEALAQYLGPDTPVPDRVMRTVLAGFRAPTYAKRMKAVAILGQPGMPLYLSSFREVCIRMRILSGDYDEAISLARGRNSGVLTAGEYQELLDKVILRHYDSPTPSLYLQHQMLEMQRRAA